MFSNKFLFLLLLVHFNNKYSNGQRDNKFFRKDYKFIEKTQSFYKIHTIFKNWRDAEKTCALEGARLFYPDDANEAFEVMVFLNETQPFRWVYVGISDVLSRGVFETIEGIPVSEVYNTWTRGELNAEFPENCAILLSTPTLEDENCFNRCPFICIPISDVYNTWTRGEPNGEFPENCAILLSTLTLEDENCSNRYPFICKKTLPTLEWNHNCNIPNVDYDLTKTSGRCYKFHLTPMNWSEAYAVCSAEQSYLAIINSQAEADYLVKLTARARKDKVTGAYLSGAVLLGFHNKSYNGWNTIRGTTLNNSGYTKWGSQQPDGGDKEMCGSMFYNGLLNDIGCEQKSFFICEHDIDRLVPLIDIRFTE